MGDKNDMLQNLRVMLRLIKLIDMLWAKRVVL